MSRDNRGALTDPSFPAISNTTQQVMALAAFPFLVTGGGPRSGSARPVRDSLRAEIIEVGRPFSFSDWT